MPDSVFTQLSGYYQFGKRRREYFYNPADLDRAVEEELQEQKTIFLNFLWELKAVCQALAADPIYVGSGIRQPHKRQQILLHPEKTFPHPRVAITHPQRTYQDVKTDIANQLSGLPNYTAWVKIAENVPHNPGRKCRHCGKQSGSGALYCTRCGKKGGKLPNEYTITTLKPAGGIGAQQLKQRIASIQARNLRDGYVRKRADVEAEITQRQVACSGGSAPQPQQLQQPVPQQKPQQRFARQVPVQGHCPKCNATNPRGARFCNQCGRKL